MSEAKSFAFSLRRGRSGCANREDGSSSDRRGFLRSIIATGAAAAVVAVPVAASAEAHPDAALFALVDRMKGLDGIADAAWQALEDAENRVEWPAPPPALFVREDDAKLWPWGPSGDAGALLDERDIGHIVRSSALLNRGPAEYPNSDFVAAVHARADELAAALASDKAAQREANERAGVPEADERARMASTEVRRAMSRIAKTRATTIDGLMAKLAAVAPAFVDETCGEEGDADAVLYSAAADAQALSRPGRGPRSAAVELGLVAKESV